MIYEYSSKIEESMIKEELKEELDVFKKIFFYNYPDLTDDHFQTYIAVVERAKKDNFAGLQQLYQDCETIYGDDRRENTIHGYVKELCKTSKKRKNPILVNNKGTITINTTVESMIGNFSKDATDNAEKIKKIREKLISFPDPITHNYELDLYKNVLPLIEDSKSHVGILDVDFEIASDLFESIKSFSGTLFVISIKRLKDNYDKNLKNIRSYSTKYELVDAPNVLSNIPFFAIVIYNKENELKSAALTIENIKKGELSFSLEHVIWRNYNERCEKFYNALNKIKNESTRCP